MFVFKVNGSKHKKIIFIWSLFYTFVSSNFLRWLYILLITLSGDVKLNPGPKCNAVQTLLICHWNLNSICGHNFAKLSLLRPYVSVQKFGMMYLSETYLDSSVDDESLEISGYYLICSNHPSNKKCGGISIYYKNFLPLNVTGICLLEECIAFDLIITKYFSNPPEITRNHSCGVFLKNHKYLQEMFWNVSEMSWNRHLFWDISEAP